MMFAAVLLHEAAFSWSEWVLYPDFLTGWAIFCVAYILCAGPLRHRFTDSAPVERRQLASFGFAMLLMLVSLQGPLHELSDHYLFSAHMIQHLLIMLVMPAFLLFGTPGWMIRPILRIPGLTPLARLLTRPLMAFLLVNSLFGIWHLPGPYNLMMTEHTIHKLMHLMIMAIGVILWWPIFSPLKEFPRLAGPLQVLYLFVLGIPMMAMAVFIAFSNTDFYPYYADAPRIFPISPMQDQRLGALIMWVPGALVMWLGITFTYFRWSRTEIREDEETVGLDHAGTSGILISPPPYPDGR